MSELAKIITDLESYLHGGKSLSGKEVLDQLLSGFRDIERRLSKLEEAREEKKRLPRVAEFGAPIRPASN
jgi:hypothetical protein